MTVSLTGFMASGKTTFGKAAAARLGWNFIDLDKEVEQIFGPIPEIFACGGEQRFRKAESEVLSEVFSSELPDTIISLGGGTILSRGNLRLIREKSKIIWLDTAWPLIMDEMECCKRPLARQLGEEGLLNLYKSRRSSYRLSADMVVIIDQPDYRLATDDVTQAVRTILSL